MARRGGEQGTPRPLDGTRGRVVAWAQLAFQKAVRAALPLWGGNQRASEDTGVTPCPASLGSVMSVEFRTVLNLKPN